MSSTTRAGFTKYLSGKPVKHRQKKERTPYTGYNLRKLSVLIAVFNHYRTAGEIAKLTLPQGEPFLRHKQNIKKCVSRLRHYFKHPYLKSVHLKKSRAGGHIAYQCNDKGRRVACEMAYRKLRSRSLIWNGRYHVRCSNSCKTCSHNPTKIPNIQALIIEPDSRNRVLMECPECNYKKMIYVDPSSGPESITFIKNLFLEKHIKKEHTGGSKYDKTDEPHRKRREGR